MLSFTPPVKKPITVTEYKREILSLGLPGFLLSVRKNWRIHQSELAKKLNVSTSLLSRIECGRIPPALCFIYRWCSVFDVSFSEIVKYLPDKIVHAKEKQEKSL